MPVLDTLRADNLGRDPELLALKYQKMAASPFVFLRGSARLFYERLCSAAPLPDTPAVWLCGDMHMENFGSYKGDNRQVYFDINDFDEAALGPAAWDVVRMLVSVELGCAEAGVDAKKCEALCRDLMDAYAAALAGGKAYWIERSVAEGPILRLLEGVRGRKRSEFVAARTELRHGHLQLRIDGKKTLQATASQRQAVEALVAGFAAQHADPAFFQVLDVARRVAGTGSLGLERYAVLVHGKCGQGGAYLFDLKRARPSCLAPHLTVPQPAWRSEAQRVVAVQTRMQAVPMAYLHALEADGASWVLRELQPTEDRVALAAQDATPAALGALVRSMGQLLAWAQLRSAGRQGAAMADALIAFGAHTNWQAQLLSAASAQAAQVRADAQTFQKALHHDPLLG